MASPRDGRDRPALRRSRCSWWPEFTRNGVAGIAIPGRSPARVSAMRTPAAGTRNAGTPYGEAGPQPAPGRGAPPTILASLPRVLIVRPGSTAPEVQRRHGDYDRWFRDALADHDLAFDLCDATRSAIPDPSSHAGITVTGS